MPEPQHEPNPSGSDPAGGPASGPSAGAGRFWEQYGEARRADARNGGDNGGAGDGRERGHEGERDRGGEHQCLEWCPICRGADVVRATTPPELRDQLETIQRDALAMVRALIDAYLAKQAEAAGARPRSGDRGVEDIPID